MAFTMLTLATIRQRGLGMVDASDANSHYGATLCNQWLNDGLQQMTAKGRGIEDTFSFTTTASTRAYVLPTNFIEAKQVLYNGTRLRPMALIEQDFFSSGSSYPDRYALWGTPLQILFGPTPPSAAEDVVVYYFREPNTLTNDGDEPEIPNRFRHYLSDYLAANYLLADGNAQDANLHLQRYNEGVKEYMQWCRFRSRDQFKTVVEEWG